MANQSAPVLEIPDAQAPAAEGQFKWAAPSSPAKNSVFLPQDGRKQEASVPDRQPAVDAQAMAPVMGVTLPDAPGDSQEKPAISQQPVSIIPATTPNGPAPTQPVPIPAAAGAAELRASIEGPSAANQSAPVLEIPVAQAPAAEGPFPWTAKSASPTKNSVFVPQDGRKPEASVADRQSAVDAQAMAPVMAVTLSDVLSDSQEKPAISQQPASITSATTPNAPASAPPLPIPAVAGPAELPVSNKEAAAPLSFAAKIQAPQTSDTNQAQHSVLNDNVATVASEWKKAQRDGQATDSDAGPAAPAATPAAGTNLNLNALAPAPQPANSQSSPITRREIPTLSAVKQVETPAATHPQAAGTQLKDVSFRIAQPDGSSVQLRLVQQSGELKVAVHAASPELNQGLRDALPDLTRKLSDSGFHSETWRPGVASTGASAEAEASRDQSSNSNSGNPDAQSGSQQQGRGQRDQQQPQRPRWVEELENSTQSTSSFQGELYGIRN